MIIGVCGLIGSGKGTVSDILIEERGFIKVSFADSLKDVVASVFSWDRALLEGDTDESREWREQVDQWWSVKLDIPNVTPRWVLQQWGTEGGRDAFHQDIWIRSLERKMFQNPDANYVIPDTRFPNEVDMIQNLGGQVWRVRRGADPRWFSRYRLRDKKPHSIHPSEWMWAKTKFDRIIENNGTLEDLRSNIPI